MKPSHLAAISVLSVLVLETPSLARTERLADLTTSMNELVRMAPENSCSSAPLVLPLAAKSSPDCPELERFVCGTCEKIELREPRAKAARIEREIVEEDLRDLHVFEDIIADLNTEQLKRLYGMLARKYTSKQIAEFSDKLMHQVEEKAIRSSADPAELLDPVKSGLSAYLAASGISTESLAVMQKRIHSLRSEKFSDAMKIATTTFQGDFGLWGCLYDSEISQLPGMGVNAYLDHRTYEKITVCPGLMISENRLGAQFTLAHESAHSIDETQFPEEMKKMTSCLQENFGVNEKMPEYVADFLGIEAIRGLLPSKNSAESIRRAFLPFCSKEDSPNSDHPTRAERFGFLQTVDVIRDALRDELKLPPAPVTCILSGAVSAK